MFYLGTDFHEFRKFAIAKFIFDVLKRNKHPYKVK